MGETVEILSIGVDWIVKSGCSIAKYGEYIYIFLNNAY